MDARPALGTRRMVYALAALLWLSGGALFVLQSWFRRAGEFGLERHALEPGARTLHGLLAIAALFGLGWLTASHVGVALASPRARRGGPLLLAMVATLAASGFALFYLSADAPRAASGWLHEALGALVLVPALWHWRRRGR